MSEPTETIDHLQVTVAHHADNDFYMIGRIMPAAGGGVLSWNAQVVADVTHEVPMEALFAALPDEPCALDELGRSTCPEFCIVLDGCTEGGDVFDNKEIDVETADLLLDGEFSQRLAAARTNLAEHYAYERRRPEGVSSMDWLLRLAHDAASEHPTDPPEEA